MKTIKNKGKGFTLVEVLVVIVIIAILAAIAIPALTNYMDKAKNKVLLANTSDLARYIQAEILYENFDDEHIFTFKGSSNDTNTDFLSRYLEVNWEVLNLGGDEDNSNNLGLKNPVSGKVGIVNWPNRLPNQKEGLYCQQAFYITRDGNAVYTPGAARRLDYNNGYYHGSLVMWYNAENASEIYLYYVSTDGMQSDEYYLFEKGVS